MLYARSKYKIALVLYHGRRELVDAVCGVVYIKDGVLFRISPHELDDLVLSFVIDICRMIRLWRSSSSDGAVLFEFFVHLVRNRLERRRGRSVVKVRDGHFAAVPELHLLIETYDIVPDVVDRIAPVRFLFIVITSAAGLSA